MSSLPVGLRVEPIVPDGQLYEIAGYTSRLRQRRLDWLPGEQDGLEKTRAKDRVGHWTYWPDRPTLYHLKQTGGMGLALFAETESGFRVLGPRLRKRNAMTMTLARQPETGPANLVDLQQLHAAMDNWVVVGFDLGVVNLGVCRLHPGGKVKTSTIHNPETEPEARLDWMVREVEMWAATGDVVGVERVYLKTRKDATGEETKQAANAATTIDLAELQGAARLATHGGYQAIKSGMFFRLTPREIDATLGIGPYGKQTRADRKDSLRLIMRHLVGKVPQSQHEVDAWAVAYAASIHAQQAYLQKLADEQDDE